MLKNPYLIMENNSNKGFFEDLIEAISMDSSLQEWVICVSNYRIRNVKSVSVVFVERSI
jgi:hypothetical protein